MNRSPVLSMLLLWILCASSLAKATTYIQRDITMPTTWRADQSPIIVSKNILVQEGITLTIEPGTQVLFMHKTTLVVEGALVAEGEEREHIYFGGLDNAAWEGIHLRKSELDYDPQKKTGTRFIYCDFRGTGEAPSLMLRSQGCDLLLQSCVLERAYIGLQVERQAKLWMTDCFIRGCHRAINVCNTAIADIHHNKIVHCHSLLLGGTVTFENNLLKRFSSGGQHSGMIIWMIGGGEVEIRNNQFSKFEHAAIKLYKTTQRSSVLIEQNDFKGNAINLLLSCQYYNKGVISIKDNNFYNYRKYQVAIYGPCYDSVAPTAITIGSNYWGRLSDDELINATLDYRQDASLQAVVTYDSLLPFDLD